MKHGDRNFYNVFKWKQEQIFRVIIWDVPKKLKYALISYLLEIIDNIKGLK